MKTKKKTFSGLLKSSAVRVLLLSSMVVAPVLASSSTDDLERSSELKSVLEKYDQGDLSKERLFEVLDEMLDKAEYASFLGPHIMMAAASDMVSPEDSERVFRRALSSLEGKNFVIFLMRHFDRAMEIDRVYLYDENRILTDPEYRRLWQNREIYNFTVSELDAITECHDLFSEKDEWRESKLKSAVNEPPCSTLKNL